MLTNNKITTTLFIISLLLGGIMNNVQAQVNETDSLSLVQLYENLNGSNLKRQTGWLTAPVSIWKLVVTNVISIYLIVDKLFPFSG